MKKTFISACFFITSILILLNSCQQNQPQSPTDRGGIYQCRWW
ncbi:MAG: hypothetical protein ABI761_18280 [Saprospiraceae bacterium]